MTITNDTTQIPVRLAFDSFAAGYSRAMAHLDQAATKELDKAEIDPKLRELVRIRASQLNGCAYCIDMHTKDARAIGETEQRIYGLAAWPETPYFTPRERAALAFTESVTRLSDTHVPDQAYQDVAARVHPAGGRRAGQPHRDHQRLECHQRQHPRLDSRLVPAELRRGMGPVPVSGAG